MQAEELRAWRHRQGWTMVQASRYLGTSKTNLYRWEKGVHAAPQTIDILCHLLDEKRNIRKVEDFLYSALTTE